VDDKFQIFSASENVSLRKAESLKAIYISLFIREIASLRSQ
jgi:hypothetical protein